MILQILSIALLLVYAWFMLRYWLSWQKIPAIKPLPNTPPIFFSVLIPVRNEASHLPALLQDLENLNYPKDSFEVLVIDDHSTDGTAQEVYNFQQHSQLKVKLLFLASFPGKRQKKAAIEAGVSQACGPWIVCTDGDCRIPANWLASYNQVLQQGNPKMISGPVMLSPANNLFEKLQALEFSALIGVGAAGIHLNSPTMCNGANLAYEKEAFYAVDGFKGNEQVASGDDEFLLHKISRKFPGQTAFLKSEDALVSTSPQAKVSSFFQQRVRWASKWKHYESGSSRWLAIMVLGANAVVFGAFVAAVLKLLGWSFFFAALALKLVPDFILLQAVLGLFQKKRLLSLIILLQAVYLPYVLVTAVLGFTGTYHWKDRKHVSA